MLGTGLALPDWIKKHPEEAEVLVGRIRKLHYEQKIRTALGTVRINFFSGAFNCD